MKNLLFILLSACIASCATKHKPDCVRGITFTSTDSTGGYIDKAQADTTIWLERPAAPVHFSPIIEHSEIKDSVTIINADRVNTIIIN
jgi:hypothetical protein